MIDLKIEKEGLREGGFKVMSLLILVLGVASIVIPVCTVGSNLSLATLFLGLVVSAGFENSLLKLISLIILVLIDLLILSLCQ